MHFRLKICLEILSFLLALFNTIYCNLKEMEFCLTYSFPHIPILHPLKASEKKCFQEV